mgnify:CR=1 FL=1
MAVEGRGDRGDRGDVRHLAPALSNLALVCLLYTSDAADERSSVDLGGRRIIKKKKKKAIGGTRVIEQKTKKTGARMGT